MHGKKSGTLFNVQMHTNCAFRRMFLGWLKGYNDLTGSFNEGEGAAVLDTERYPEGIS